MLEAWTSERTPAEVERASHARGVWAAAMRRGNDIAQMATNGSASSSRSGGARASKSSGCRLRFAAAAPALLTPAPRVGADSDDVLRDWLKLDATAIDALMPRAA